MGQSAVFAQEAPANDAILIVGHTPESFVDGQEAEVTVTVAYNLVSFDEALIDLCSNELKAQGFFPVAHLPVKKGNGTVVISGKLQPRYWTANAPAKIAVYLSGGNDPVTRRRPLASDDTRIAVSRRAQPERDPTNPNPADIFEDAIEIKSVVPDFFVEGRETEVTVTVAYELLSREEGDIKLGSSEGRGNGYRIIGSTRVAIGRGEAVVRAKVVPTKTGGLPFTKVFVNLSEYPHRPTWSPLADDSRVIEIR